MHTSKSGEEEEVDRPSVENGVPHGCIYYPTVCSSSYVSGLFHILTSNPLDLHTDPYGTPVHNNAIGLNPLLPTASATLVC